MTINTDLESSIKLLLCTSDAQLDPHLQRIISAQHHLVKPYNHPSSAQPVLDKKKTMSSKGSESYIQKLQHYCATNQFAQPQFQDYSDPRGIRTAWSSSVLVCGREYRAHLWRDYRFLEQSREEAAEVAWKAIHSSHTTTHGQYTYDRGYTTAH
jgi:hypothetical protein